MELQLIRTPLTAVSAQARQTLGKRVGVALVMLCLKLQTSNLFPVLGCQTKPFQDAFSSSSWMKLFWCRRWAEWRIKQREIEGEERSVSLSVSLQHTLLLSTDSMERWGAARFFMSCNTEDDNDFWSLGLHCIDTKSTDADIIMDVSGICGYNVQEWMQ